MFHILDIDNTLFFTNDLNNKAYIFALSLLGLKVLAPCKRITRTVVASWYPSLTNADPSRIEKILDYNNITDYKHIRFSDKSQDDICFGIQEFCQIFDCEKGELCFYEDDRNVITYLQLQGVKVKEVVV